ncbi:hypothetical protein CEXT_688341 [Caerostris extrusa]|uniref:Uncharacterized protein n=1 Tax=Caerostris extrusa TaxID=172846 RepID=A0AAV4Q1B6_CAEEX|nr:hypothetical protein CEXT_688341 [Caerostris extrusa]
MWMVKTGIGWDMYLIFRNYFYVTKFQIVLHEFVVFSEERGIFDSTVCFNSLRNLQARVFDTMSGPVLRKGLLLGLGNPLLDISANTDHSFLEKRFLFSNNGDIF